MSYERKLRVRRLLAQSCDEEEEPFVVTFPASCSTVRFHGNDPEALKDFKDKTKEGLYYHPFSTSFPSYDAMFIVKKKVFFPGDKSDDLLLLNEQMTVAGASGITPRPKHKMLRVMRMKSMKAFGLEVVTCFLVPTICFNSFKFQKESNISGAKGISKRQPAMQYVMEIPDFDVF